ncbi:MAG: 16S rRNA (cytidine(1402)-2'-O)-methyltransferase [Acidimicrobiia bacterium]|nr:16S rRNA (cytidine(1402)-2'-O)-methyltransferase [Acidimicrobiia bacterium]
MTGRLVVCATPIGNLGDISQRLATTLAEADVVYAEDTRRTGILLNHIGASPEVRSFFVGNEGVRAGEIAQRITAGETVALVTDAGTPALADPGVLAVRAARDAGGIVTVIPGPSAVTAALAVSGFGGDRFVFEGFLPRKGGDRSDRLATMSSETRPVVWFSSPRRVLADLADLAAVAGGDRQICVARELTKQFEEVWWGTLHAAIGKWNDTEPRGEFTLVLAPGESATPSLEEATETARRLMTDGLSRSEAARTVARETGLPRLSIYDGI